jgi:signal peptidase I
MVEHPGNFAYIHVLGDDMEPTLSPGDWILVDRTQYLEEPIERGDIVWFISPGETEAESKQFLRVAGLPNESISFNATGELMVTGARFTRHPFLSERDFRLNNKPPEPLQLGENQYYLLGDNRSRARDSRGVGAIERKSLRGKAVSVLFPPNRVGKLLDSN